MRRTGIVLFGLGLILVPAVAWAQTAPPIPDRNAQPVMTTDGEGGAHVIWVEGIPGEHRVLYSSQEGSDWTEPELVADGVTALDPALLFRPDGVACALWTLISLWQSCREGGTWAEPIEVARHSVTASYAPAYGPDGQLRILYLEPTSSILFDEQRINQADEIVTFPESTVDADGGIHAFWFDFTADRGWLWSYSADDGQTWTAPESISLSLPQAGGTLVGADARGAVYSVLLNAFSIESRRWTATDAWSEAEVIDFTPGAIDGDLTIGPDGDLTVVAATSEGALTFSHPGGGVWANRGVVAGSEDRNIDSVLTGGGTVLWHELGAAGYNQGRVETPSITEAVPSPSDINLDPLVIAASVALTGGMLFLAPFPAELFNETLASHHDQIRRWFRRRQDEAENRGIWDRPLGIGLFVVACALLYGFLDPAFGLDSQSGVTFVGLVIGVIVTTLGFALPALVVHRTRSGSWGRLRALPIALVVGFACVVVSRLIGFLPGYLYGVVLGLVFVQHAGEGEEAGESLATGLTLLVLATGSWIGLGLVRSSDGVLGDVAEAALAMITVAAFEAVVFGMLPLRGMPGRALFKAHKVMWLVVWGIGLLAFFHVLINPQSGYLADTALVPVATTFGLLAGFSLVSVGMWGWFAWKERGQK